MQRKIKAVLRSSRRNKSPSSRSPRQSYESSDAGSPRSENFASPPTSRGRGLSDASKGSSPPGPRSRPVSSVYEDRRTSNVSAPHSTVASNTEPRHIGTVGGSHNGSIANDYRAYLPALSPVDDSQSEDYMTLGSERRLNNGESVGRHEEDVADRNIDQHGYSRGAGNEKPLPAAPRAHNSIDVHARKSSLDSGSLGPVASSVPSGTASGYAASKDAATQRSTASAVTHPTSTNDRRQHDATPDWKLQQAVLLDGVVDLRNTVDTDKHVHMAAPVVHEVVKRNEREIMQQKIYREIHNYTHYHRLQPVMHTEVLPPRHFIPNSQGEGLIEISADELPSRTGQNRWWEIVQKEVPQTYEIQSRWRTEPEVIHGEPYMTKEGFERKETTIIYPPTLEDMSNYNGVVQPVHFDHKTGERWLGEVTTMTKLKEQHHQDALTMRELTESLPEVPDSPTVKRKPVGL